MRQKGFADGSPISLGLTLNTVPSYRVRSSSSDLARFLHESSFHLMNRGNLSGIQFLELIYLFPDYLLNNSRQLLS